MREPLFSIIVPVSRSEEIVSRLIESLNMQIFEIDLIELILIHDAPSSFNLTTSFAIQNIVTENPHPSAKRNLGAREAKGKFLIFLDDDVTLPPNWLIHAQEKIEKDPDSIYNGPDFNDCEKALDLATEILKNHPLAEGTSNRVPTRDTKVSFLSISLCNTIIKKELFQKLRGFNKEIHFTLDDTEFFYLAQKSGIIIIKSPKLRVNHLRPKLIIPFIRHRCNRRFWVGYHSLLLPQIFLKTTAFKVMFLSWILLPFVLYILSELTLMMSFSVAFIYTTIIIITNLGSIIKKPVLALILPPLFFILQTSVWFSYTIGFFKGLLELPRLYRLRTSQSLRWEKQV